MTQQLHEQPDAFDDNTVVLERRRLRPESHPSSLSRFGDNVWDLSPGIFENHVQRYIINFAQVPDAWLRSVKSYFWILINEDAAKPILDAPSAPRRLGLSSIAHMLSPLRWLIHWFHAHGYDTLQAATPKVLDRLLADLSESGLSLPRRRQIIVETRRVWVHRNVTSPQLRMPEAAPWQEERPGDLLSHRFKNTGNLTPRISDETLIPLMAWAFRVIDELAPDITAAYHDYLKLISDDYRHTSNGDRKPQPPGTRRLRLQATLDRLRHLGVGLPGNPDPSGAPRINWTHLGRLTGSFGNTHAKYDREIVHNSGLPVDPQSYVTTKCTALLDGQLWCGPYIAWDDVIPLTVHLQTACFIVIAYLSGMRPGEALNLERGCHRINHNTKLHELHGTTWKNARTPEDAKDPEGQPRRNPWIVHPLAGKSVEVLEQVHTSELLFPKTLRPKPLRGTKPRADVRAGSGQTTAKMTTDIESFIGWVNDYCVRHQRNDRIPEDADGRVTANRFRRTLAWHIVRRPRGLVAAAIQYNHISTLVTQGYSGNYHSGFPNELAMERWLERIERLTDIDQYLESGGHVSGPAAADLRARTHQVTSKFQGRVLPTRRQAEKLLTDPSLQVFKGDGIHCVFDKTTALCTKNEDAPNLGQCYSACGNIARTDDDILEVKASLDRLPKDSFAPPIRHHRAQQVAEHLTGIISSHEH
ncbi:hypothetical protein [Specibacter sp. NPDC078692]|uniref:hypothetical protein n=1 Tax=Specibacter sp. NPDC078692 TaxID=3155818 RepID=UPI003413D80D